MTVQEFKHEVDTYYRKKMNRCAVFDEEKYRIYEMFLDWYADGLDISEEDEMDEFAADNMREYLWDEFCDVHCIDPKKVCFGDYYPDGLDSDERDDYDEAIGDMITKDW